VAALLFNKIQSPPRPYSVAVFINYKKFLIIMRSYFVLVN
jgi:hypothetical protein